MINDYSINNHGVNGGRAIASASGAIISIEQEVDLRSTATGNVISIEQVVKSKASGAIIVIQQVVI